MMVSARRVLANDQGMVLFATLTLIALLTVIGIGALLSVQNDFRISTNITAGTSAFYLADSGIEWAKDQLDQAGINPPILENHSQTFRSGSFAVAFSAPARISPLSATVVVRSIGSLGNSSQTVQAQLTKSYDLIDAAVALRGNSRGVNFTGDSFSISGSDFDPATRTWASEGKSRLGISVSSESLMAQLESGLSALQKEHVVGESADGAAIAQSDRLDNEMVGRLADDLCASPIAHVTIMPGSGNLSLANQTWGTRTAPQIRCIEGWAEAGDSVAIGGNFGGAGILVVKNSELVALGTLYWEGLVLVTGNHVGFRVEGPETKEIFGGVIVNETGPPSDPGPALFDLRGSVRITFSRGTLRNLAALIPPASLARSYIALPFRLTQDYWRAENP